MTAESLIDHVIDSVDWASLRTATGDARGVPSALRRLLISDGVEEASLAWTLIEEHVFSQGAIYSSAEPAMRVAVLALAVDQPSWRLGRILDLIYFVAAGASPSDPDLRGRCHDRIREGLSELTRMATTSEGWPRHGALEIIEVVAPELYESIGRSASGSSPGA